MTETELIHFINNPSFGKEYLSFIAFAEQRLQFHSKYSECDSGGITAKDIVQQIFLNIIEKPETIPKEINRKEFRNKFFGMINNEAKHKKTIHASSYDPMEKIQDEEFYDFVISQNQDGERLAQERLLHSAILDQISELLLNDERAWVVLSDLRDGKKPQEIAQLNGIDIDDVRKDVRKIVRLIESKASVSV
jgi:DNA-directed RNA polymerase specialized sigma24 family protein